jgi:heme-degrading monooxygenase HmoA
MSDAPIFIAMNRFQVTSGAEAAFEKLWRERPSRIADEPGFLAFNLLRGPERDGHTLYASHTIWQTRADFEAWTKSEAFRAAHHGSGTSQTLTVGHPQFEGFEAVEGLAIGHAR